MTSVLVLPAPLACVGAKVKHAKVQDGNNAQSNFPRMRAMHSIILILSLHVQTEINSIIMKVNITVGCLESYFLHAAV